LVELITPIKRRSRADRMPIQHWSIKPWPRGAKPRNRRSRQHPLKGAGAVLAS